MEPISFVLLFLVVGSAIRIGDLTRKVDKLERRLSRRDHPAGADRAEG